MDSTAFHLSAAAPSNTSCSPPAELLQRDQWVCWRYEPSEQAGAKPRKVPYHPRPYRASSTKRSDWSSYSDVCAATSERPDFFSGVGFVFSPKDPYTGVDFDDCLDESGTFVDAWAEGWVRRLSSYTEISPSGRGVKVFVRGAVPAAIKIKGERNVEVYSEARFFTVTGQLLPGVPTAIRNAQTDLAELMAEVRPEGVTKPSDVGTTSEIDNQDVERELQGIGRLLGADGLPRRLSQRAQARRVLGQALAGWPDGAPDYSLMRHIVVKGLLLHGYPDTEIAALLWHYRPALNGGGKSARNWRADIARMIGKVRAERPDVMQTPSRGAPKPAVLVAPEPPQRSRARKDRPQPFKNGVAGYLAWLETQADAEGIVPFSQSECAERRGCDKKTIQRYDKKLIAAGLIVRERSEDRQKGHVKLCQRGDNIIHETVPTEAMDVGTTYSTPDRHETAALRRRGAQTANNLSQCIGGTQVVCVPPVGGAADLRENARGVDSRLVAHALASPPGSLITPDPRLWSSTRTSHSRVTGGISFNIYGEGDRAKPHPEESERSPPWTSTKKRAA
jgi:DNA-binding MarR family transcriptional regulator